jgi:o-succinylbenzoate synthase
MKITGIELFDIRVPLKRTYTLSKVIGPKKTTECVLLKLHTDEGIVGIGEADPHVPFTEESMESITSCILNYLAPPVIGQDPEDIAGINLLMDNAVKLNLMAKGAIDMACHDISGKIRGLPVHEMLGGPKRESIPLVWSVGNSLPGQTLEDIREVYDQGYRTVMIKTGHFEPGTDVERVRLVRETWPDLKIIIDVNQGWDMETAITTGQRMESLGIEFLEQPVPFWDIEGLAKIRKAVSIPISVDESLLTIHDAKRIIRGGAADIFSVKVSKNGGITKTRELVELARENGMKCWMNSMLEEGVTEAASLQLGLSSTNLLDMGHAYFSPLRLAEDISTYSDNIRGLEIYSSGQPGLGVKLKENVVQTYIAGRNSI